MARASLSAPGMTKKRRTNPRTNYLHLSDPAFDKLRELQRFWQGLPTVKGTGLHRLRVQRKVWRISDRILIPRRATTEMREALTDACIDACAAADAELLLLMDAGGVTEAARQKAAAMIEEIVMLLDDRPEPPQPEKHGEAVEVVEQPSSAAVPHDGLTDEVARNEPSTLDTCQTNGVPESEPPMIPTQ